MEITIADVLADLPHWSREVREAIVDLLRIVQDEWDNDMLVGEAGDALGTIRKRLREETLI